mmetsp:Transcript_3407/g.3892  ORF Transcript_3407/g.3892 Transcript_3407/m.3892 type:complete len:179 (-) Transcript_3407:76-612(-)
MMMKWRRLFVFFPVTLALQRFTTTRTIPVSADIAFDACIHGWREDNFKLPIPPPILIDPGNPLDGSGLEIARIPPFFLRERVNSATRPERMHYGIVNPGLFTWPVSEHRGIITFTQYDREPEMSLTRKPQSISGSICTELTWSVEWEPLPGFDWLTRVGTEAIISAAADYVAEESSKV